MAKKRNKSISCLNCDFIFKETNNYCPNCGQENHDLKVPFSHLIAEIFESTIHFDEKIIKTLKLIFTKPGQLTLEFIEGKRARFVPPIRLYVFVSFIFFLILGTVTHKSTKKNKKLFHIDQNTYNVDSLVIEDSIKNIHNHLSIKLDTNIYKKEGDPTKLFFEDLKFIHENEESIDSIFEVRNIHNTTFNRKLIIKLASITNGGLDDFISHLIKYFSFALFLLMPAFALMLKIIYRKTNRYYYEHLIFSIHLHVIAMILCSIMILFSMTNLTNYLIPITLISLFVYEFLSMLRFYKQSKRKTIIKCFILNSFYLILNITIIVGIFFIAILL